MKTPLAPMSATIRVLTGVGLLLPAALFAAALLVPGDTQRLGLMAVATLVASAYLAVWLWFRPGYFRVTEVGLEIGFPLRDIAVRRSNLVSATVLSPAELRARIGFAIRVGAGGLWGGFGWLWSRRAGWVEHYVSRLHGFVWLERRAGRPLLLTPADPEAFVQALDLDAG